MALITGGECNQIIDLYNLKGDEIKNKLDNVSYENKKQFIDKYCGNRPFLRNVIIKEERFFNNAIIKVIGGANGILKAGFLSCPDEKFYGVSNIDDFLDKVEYIIKNNIKIEIEKNRDEIKNLELMLNI